MRRGEGFSWAYVDGMAAFYSCYSSPNRSIADFEDFLTDLASTIGAQRGKQIVVTGDFNAANTA